MPPRLTQTMPPYPVRREEAIERATRLLRTGGDWTRLEGAPELEADLQAWHGADGQGRAPIVWYVSSGTAALQAIMLGHGIGPGDEVITTPYTWAATVSAILAIGAIPIFADVDPISGLIDPASIGPLISARSRAIMIVHLFGHPADCTTLRQVADNNGLLLLEDGSQAHGASFDGRQVGDWGDAAAFSCMGMKLLAGTEGGYAVFRDPAVAECAYLYGKHPRGLPAAQARSLTEQGQLDALQLGWRPCAVGAELIRAQLPHLSDEIAARQKNADTLRAELRDCPAIIMPTELPQAIGCYHLLSLVLSDHCPHSKASVIERLGRCGAGAFDYIPKPIHQLDRINAFEYDGPPVFWHAQLERAGMDYRSVVCPGAEQRCQRSIEFAFNWTEPNPTAMRELAACIKWACGAEE